MPTLNITKKTKKETNQRNQTTSREVRMKAYNNTEWKHLRNTYIKEHPLCEMCLEKGKVVPAEDIHHKQSPFKNGDVDFNKLLDYDNLQALCKECHGNIHAGKTGKPTIQDVLRQLADLLDENKTDEELEQ